MRGGLVLSSAAALAAALVATGCSVKEGNDDVVAGKQLFVQKCGSCHVLSRAGTKGTTGPNLDEAFHQSISEKFGEDAIRSVILKQILFPARGGSGGETGAMPAGLVKGDDAQDVAAYVALSVAKPGKDTGLLATAVKAQTSNKPAIAKNGVLTIPADPSGGLAFVNKTAEAPAGQLKIEMPNKSGVAHDITIDGKGKGKVVTSGVSDFSASFAPGKYTYFCSVPGHEAAGMKGTLTVTK
jgi:plastocyanin